MSTIQPAAYAAAPQSTTLVLEHGTAPIRDAGTVSVASPARLNPPQGPGTVTYYDMSPGSDVPAVALGPDGSVWFLSAKAGIVGWIEGSGAEAFFEPGITGNVFVYSIVNGSDGAMWFSATAGWIGRITCSGDYSRYPIHGQPFVLAPARDGGVWITEDNDRTVVRLTPDGHATDYAIPRTIAGPGVEGPDGAFWFKTLDGVGRLTQDGSFSTLPAVPGYGDLSFGPSGELWVISQIPDSALQQWSPVGAVISQLQLNLNSTAMTVASDGTLWFLGIAGPASPYGVLLSQVKGQSVQTVGFGHYAGNSIAIAADGIWFGVDFGLDRYAPA